MVNQIVILLSKSNILPWFGLRCSYSSMRAYGQSKLCNVLHANELTKQLKVTRKTRDLSNQNLCFHGYIDSNLV